MSLPTRGGWIEIEGVDFFLYSLFRSLPTRGGWIEICCGFRARRGARSLPTRGGWIEIVFMPIFPHFFNVPPHTGRVD